MGEGNHLATTEKVAQPKGRWMWLFGGAAMAIVASGLLMQYVRGTSTKAASDPPAGTARVGRAGAGRPESLARVGSETITYDAVAEECVKRYGREVLDDLIHRLIIQQACEENKISVSEREIDDEISRIAKRFNLDVAQWLQMLQAERNITPLQYRQSIIFPMLALKKLAGEEVDITEKEMKEAFVRNYGPRVKARMIMFGTQRHATECYDELMKDPEGFEEMAAKKSIDPSSRALGGQIPPIARFNGNTNLENCAFKLKMNEISAVIEVAPSRFVILKCEGRTEPAVEDMELVKEQLYEDLKETKIQANVATMFEKLKNKTIVDNYLTGATNRQEGAAPGKDPRSAIQPASGTQTKQNSSPARSANSSSAAPAKPTRN